MAKYVIFRLFSVGYLKNAFNGLFHYYKKQSKRHTFIVRNKNPIGHQIELKSIYIPMFNTNHAIMQCLSCGYGKQTSKMYLCWPRADWGLV